MELDPKVIKYKEYIIIENFFYKLHTAGEVYVSRKGCL